MSERDPNNTNGGLLLAGLDGSNPLGFLAAVGAFRITSALRSDTVMQWEIGRGTWVPRLFSSTMRMDDLVRLLIEGIRSLGPSPWDIDARLPFDPGKLRDAQIDAIKVASSLNRNIVDHLTALGVASITDRSGNFRDTSLRLVRSGDSGGNGLLAYARRIFSETTEIDISKALTEAWDYQDENCAMRWDPMENKAYANQWTDPSNQKTLSVRGANCLALAAMSVFPTVPKSNTVQTVGFHRKNRKEFLTWPIWSVPISINTAKSLISSRLLHEVQPDQREAHSRGISAVYRCERKMTSKYYRNFSPSLRVC